MCHVGYEVRGWSCEGSLFFFFFFNIFRWEVREKEIYELGGDFSVMGMLRRFDVGTLLEQ